MKNLYLLIVLIIPMISFGQLDPEKIAEIADKSVVYIETFDAYNQKLGTGSGVIISNDGKIVTNYHVFSNRGSYMTVKIGNVVYHSKQIINYDVVRDYLIFRIDNIETTPLALGSSDNLKKGQKIYAIGSPFGYENTFSNGIISGLRNQNNQNVIQHTAPISPGSSGGALLNDNAELIGINVSVARSTLNKDGSINAAQDIGFSIPINEIKKAIVKNDKSDYYNIPKPEKYSEKGQPKQEPKFEYKREYVPPSNPNYYNPYGIGNAQITLYTSCPNCIMDIYVNEKWIGKTNTFFTAPPICGQYGTLSAIVPAGRHRVYAKDIYGNTWDTYINVAVGQCVVSGFEYKPASIYPPIPSDNFNNKDYESNLEVCFTSSHKYPNYVIIYKNGIQISKESIVNGSELCYNDFDLKNNYTYKVVSQYYSNRILKSGRLNFKRQSKSKVHISQPQINGYAPYVPR